MKLLPNLQLIGCPRTHLPPVVREGVPVEFLPRASVVPWLLHGALA